MIGKTSNSCGQVQASLATWFQPIGSTSKHLYSVSETWKSWSWNPRSEATETGKTIKCSCDSVQSPNSSAVSASNVEWPRALVLHFSASWLAKSYCLILHSHFPSNQSFTLCGLLVRISLISWCDCSVQWWPFVPMSYNFPKYLVFYENLSYVMENVKASTVWNLSNALCPRHP